MKFRLTANWLKEDLQSDYDKFYKDIPQDTFIKLVKLDPTFTGSGMADNKGKYTRWILDRFKKGDITEEDFGHVKDCLNRFKEESKYLVKKDINQYKSLQEIDDALNNSEHSLSHRQEVRARQKDRRNADVEKDYKTTLDGFDIYVPSSYANSCKLGQGANWCTASTESDYYYKYYKNEYGGDYYILINQDDSDEKYQFHFESSQFMNKKDSPIDLKKFFDNHLAIKDYFMPIVRDALNISDKAKEFDLEWTVVGGDADYFCNSVDKLVESRNKMSFKTAVKSVLDDYDDPTWRFWFSYNFTDAISSYSHGFFSLSEHSKQEFERLDIDTTNLEDSITSEETRDKYGHDVEDAFAYAYSEGVAHGSTNEYLNRCTEAIEDCGLTINYYDRAIEMNLSVDTIIDKYLEGTIDADGFITWGAEGCASEIVADRWDLYEPYNGWYDFDEEAFNDALVDRLSEI